MPTDEKRIVIQMLGQFAVSVDGQQLYFGENNKANFLKLIQVIFLHHKTGIAKRELIDYVFGYKELLDENNSLNNLLHQARTQLKKKRDAREALYRRPEGRVYTGAAGGLSLFV